MKNLKKIIINQAGGALINALMAAGIVGAGSYMVSQQGKVRGEINFNIRQNNVIENTVLDMKTILATEKECTEAMNQSPAFSKIGKYQTGDKIGDGVEIQRIVKLANDPAKGITDRNIKLNIVFRKNDPRKGSGGVDKGDHVWIQKFTKPDGTEVCTSFETNGIEDTVAKYCEKITGNIANYNIATGECDTSNIQGKFRDVLMQEVCEAIGGNDSPNSTSTSGGKCRQIQIAGTAFSDHLKSGLIDLAGSGTQRTGFPNSACSGVQVASGMNPDGTLNCKNIVCPQPDKSSYTAIESAGTIMCRCNRDQAERKDGVRVACNSQDPNSCVDYNADDGCGMGNRCMIRRGKFPACPDNNPPCGEVVRNSCGEICARGPVCPPPPTDDGDDDGGDDDGDDKDTGGKDQKNACDTMPLGKPCCLQPLLKNGEVIGCAEPATRMPISCENGVWTYDSCQ